jgi:hypothetical protein
MPTQADRPSRLRPLLLTLLLAAVALAATAAASAQAAGPGSSRSIVVRAIGSGGWRGLPLAGARVTVLRAGQVVARGRSGSLGMAMLHATRPVGGAGLRVLVSGGKLGKHLFRGHMVSEVGHYGWPQTIYVDSVTTIAARYHRAHPRLSRRVVVNRSRSFLRLGSSYVPGLDGRTDVAFDGRLFLTRAAHNDGYDALVSKLVGQMSGHSHQPFARPAEDPDAGASVSVLPGAGAGSVEGVAEAISHGSGFFSVLEKTDAVLDFADVIFTVADSGNSVTPAEIQQVDQQLEQIEESIAAVQGTLAEIKAEAAEHSYSQLASAAGGTVKGIEAAEAILHTAVRSAAQYGCFEAAPAEPQKCTEVVGMIKGPGGFEEEVEAAGLGGPGAVNAYGARVGGQMVPNPLLEVEGLLEAGSQVVTSKAGKLYTPEDSERVQAIAAYWISSFAEATALAPPAWGLRGANELTLQQDLAEIQPTAAAMPGAMPEAVPAGTVLDLAHSLMWPTQASGQGSSNPYGSYVERNPWHYSAGTSEWVSAGGASIPAIDVTDAAAIPYANWLIAGWVQIDPLLEEVEPGPGQSRGQALLEQSGIERDIVIPEYTEGARGLETEFVRAEKAGHGRPNSGCGNEASSSCYWPIWEADGATVGNLNRRTGTYAYHQGPYEEKEEAEYFEPIYWPWWGANEEGVLYGNDPVSNIPFLFYREVEKGQCYYYPGVGAPNAGSPGCPNQG